MLAGCSEHVKMETGLLVDYFQRLLSMKIITSHRSIVQFHFVLAQPILNYHLVKVPWSLYNNIGWPRRLSLQNGKNKCSHILLGRKSQKK